MGPKKDEKSVDTLKQNLIAAAMREVREAHRDEFDALVAAKFAAEGLTYKPRLTPEAKARQKIEALARAAGLEVAFVD